MTRLLGLVGIVILCTTASVWADSSSHGSSPSTGVPAVSGSPAPTPGTGVIPGTPVTNPEEVDFRAANPVLQSLVDAVISGDDLVDFAYPRFDEKECSAQQEKLKYDLQGSIKNTPWLEGGHAEATATSTYAADRTAGHVGVTVSMATTIRTDVLSMIRYSAYLALRKSWQLEPKFDDRYRAHLKRLAVATSLDQVYELLLSGQKLAKDIAQDQVDGEARYLKCMQDGSCGFQATPEQIAHQKQSVQALTDTLAYYDRIRFTVVKEGASIASLTIDHADMSGFIPSSEIAEHDFYLVPGPGHIRFTSTSIDATASGFHKTRIEDLDRFHSYLQTTLVGVQDGNADQKDEAQRQFRNALIQFKKFVRGEF